MDEARDIHTQTRPQGSVLTELEREIVAAHLPLLKKLAKKYQGYGFSDLLAQFCQQACEIIPAWDSSKTTFGGLLKFAIPRRVLNMARDRSRRPREMSETDLRDDDGSTPLGRRVDQSASPEDVMIHRERVAAARAIRRSVIAQDRRRYPDRVHVGRPIEAQVRAAKRWLHRHQSSLGRLQPASVYAVRAGVEVAAMSIALRTLNNRPEGSGPTPSFTQLSIFSD